ncbi:helix-turn-helix domain-containing protein [Serratia plymuthica]|uniref:helix-turn-helix domain-containing protein n=1 Tax=Serratia plymuthica TaxID=82996 RepID=UPI003DA20D87
MSANLTILISDNNQFYAQGLRHIIIRIFEKSGIDIYFTKSTDELKQPAFVFFTQYSPIQLRVESNGRMKTGIQYFFMLDMLEDKHYDWQESLWITPYIQFWDRQCCIENASNQLEHLFHKLLINHINNTYYPTGKLFTLRERQVLRYIKKGVPPTQIGRILGINRKTVSTHKRNAMNSLKLRNNQSLHCWLNTLGSMYL